MSIKKVLISIGLGITLLACAKKKDAPIQTLEVPTTNFIHVDFVAEYRHDTNAFTEGFLFHNGKLYESTGGTNLPQTKSLFGEVNLETGEIDTKVELDKSQYFGEGIAILNGQIFQLTYKSRIGFVYDLKDFKKLREFKIVSKQGWGLTTDGVHLIMSDGTNKLTYLDPFSLDEVKTIHISEDGDELKDLNELEYINGYIYANVWKTNLIVKIDPLKAKVVGKLDLSSYVSQAKAEFPNAMEMNGIAYNPEHQSLFITGKLWPKIYEIKIDL